jgi:hypothetical protein
MYLGEEIEEIRNEEGRHMSCHVMHDEVMKFYLQEGCPVLISHSISDLVPE